MKNERYDIDTVKLYESDSYVRTFDAEVISCSETKINVGGKETKAYAVVLTATAFFPEGGGQPADKGILNGQSVMENNTCMQSLKINEIACYEYLYDYETAKNKLAEYIDTYPITPELLKEYAFLSTR